MEEDIEEFYGKVQEKCNLWVTALSCLQRLWKQWVSVHTHAFPFARAAGKQVHVCSISVSSGRVCMPLAQMELCTQNNPSFPTPSPPIYKARKVGELYYMQHQKNA